MRMPELTVSRLGGDLALDLCNTVDWRLDPDRRSERLRSFAHVLAWLERVELLSPAHADRLAELAEADPSAAATEHARILALRDDSYAALTGDTASPAVLERELPVAHAASHLERSVHGVWAWHPRALGLDTPRHLLTLEFARLFASPALSGFHRCEDRHCGWVFLDTSRQHNRRWCSSADCGNRNRVRAHAERLRREAESQA
ncbi:CGNR zinc finger domain-containing protein [Agromyces mediolanus]|uniref:CGNR zinc finger domain-containing protein n=1 Tax=Agromyces mediolanus TaxID=41986 RepID=UPI00203F1ED7|nr:CGNR zinc finger domain-containing protein [Agromyces mediolanus]MCM3656133.1 CGNR zinc finger domain-containing protein [Agromyces mediolanus]